MALDATDLPFDPEYSYDIFTTGDEVPWRDSTAEVVGREVPDQMPDDLDYTRRDPAAERDSEGGTDPLVVLTLEDDGGETIRCTAKWLAFECKESFSPHGLPNIRGESMGSFGGGSRLTVQTPATGDNEITAEEARRLAAFLREHRSFGPLYALLGGTDSPEDIDAIADALERAALANQYGDRLEV